MFDVSVPIIESVFCYQACVTSNLKPRTLVLGKIGPKRLFNLKTLNLEQILMVFY